MANDVFIADARLLHGCPVCLLAPQGVGLLDLGPAERPLGVRGKERIEPAGHAAAKGDLVGAQVRVGHAAG